LKLSTSTASVIAWCLYDWAAASYSIIVITFIFATYFTTKIAVNPIVGTYQWANAASLAGVMIAISSPLFGAIADYSGQHKRWLGVFTSLCIVSTALLWFSYPTPDSVYFTLACVVIGTVGFEVALVFYNAFLPHLTTKQYLGRVSGWGWGSGYFGGIVALSIALFVFVKPKFAWLNIETAEQIRICGPFVALWFAVFALPLFFFTHDVPSTKRPLPEAIGLGCRELWSTLRKLPKEKNILLYLVSHMMYTDGLNTLFAFGGIYAAGTYGLSFEEVLVLGITMNISAGVGAALLAWVDDYLGSKATILISLVSLFVLAIPILLLHDKVYFWVLALLLCVFVGPVQSASRTLMVRLIETKHSSAEMFGLYALSGRVTAFMGPWILGVLTITFDSQRVGMATILIFFAIGAILLLPVRVPK
jgi:UMF1 family MFS transporter